MQITVQLSDELMQQPDPYRAALEALAIEGYRTEGLSPFRPAHFSVFPDLNSTAF